MTEEKIYVPTDFARGVDAGIDILLKHINKSLDTNFIDAGEAIAYLYQMRISAERLAKEAA